MTDYVIIKRRHKLIMCTRDTEWKAAILMAQGVIPGNNYNDREFFMTKKQWTKHDVNKFLDPEWLAAQYPNMDKKRTCINCGESFPATPKYFYQMNKYLRGECRSCTRLLRQKNYDRRMVSHAIRTLL